MEEAPPTRMAKQEVQIVNGSRFLIQPLQRAEVLVSTNPQANPPLVLTLDASASASASPSSRPSANDGASDDGKKRNLQKSAC